MATRRQIEYTVPGFGLSLRWPDIKSTNSVQLVDENTLLLSALDASEAP